MEAVALDKIQDLLKEIKDPEIPVLSIIDLGIVRDIRIADDITEIDITPTYSGCPAMKVIEDEIIATLKENGIENIKLKTVYSPAWTTDWINEEAREQLRQYGIAPPEKISLDKNLLSPNPKKILCPRCRSSRTEMISQFGSTACKALYRCLDCKEPFDYFKCH